MEEILDLGDGLFGILNLPPITQRRRTALVLFDAGFIHRVGPFRLHARLARAVAAEGYPVLRFDHPGVGDALALATLPAVRAAARIFDRIRARTDCERFVVGGICSAADQGWQVALNEHRAGGILMLDGLARKGPWHVIGRLKRLAREPFPRWLAALRRHLRLRPPPQAGVTAEDVRDWPAPGVERSQLASLVARDVEIFALYTGGAAHFVHPRQFRATYGAAAASTRVQFAYWEHCDHMFYAEPDRQRLIAAVVDWMQARFPDRTERPRATAGSLIRQDVV
ncbi:hypothetical protein [Dokdonella soli]|uniref:Alpha/beta hydrolase n=1 Tax=Dokdonella soli TaxID=529810 RepID=A0ABN1IN91_9GAMM